MPLSVGQTPESIFQQYGELHAVRYGIARKVSPGETVFVTDEGEATGHSVVVERPSWLVTTQASDQLVPYRQLGASYPLVPARMIRRPTKLKRPSGRQVAKGSDVCVSTCNVYPSSFDAPMDGYIFEMEDKTLNYWIAPRYEIFFRQGMVGRNVRFIRDGERVRFTIMQEGQSVLLHPSDAQPVWIPQGDVLMENPEIPGSFIRMNAIAFASCYLPVARA